MFMVSVRLTQKRMFLCALALVLVISAGVLWSKLSKEDSTLPTTKPVTENISDKKDAAAEKKTEQKPAKKADGKNTAAKTNEQRMEFIGSFGWEVAAEPVEVMEVIIPKEFDEVYQEYNSIQKHQGCDLAGYAGKRCKRYSYEVINYPGQPENVRINLLVLNNKIIGGDVCSVEAGGFMHGFTKE